MTKREAATVEKVAAVWVPIASLKPWAANPRRNAQAVDAVARSIERFGFAAPVVARAEDREVIAGHTRLAAAERLGMTEVPCRFVEGLTPEEAHALALADNRTGEVADWDEDKLAVVLSDLRTSDKALLTETGFLESELSALLDEVTKDDVKWSPLPEDLSPEARPTVVCPHCGKAFEL